MRITPGPAYMLMASFLFSVMSALVKAGGERLPAQEMVFARSVLVFLILVIMIKQRGLPLWGVDKKNLLLRGLFGFIGLSAFFYTLTKIPITDSTMLQYTNPLFTALLAIFILKERSSGQSWMNFLLAFGGILLIIRPGFSLEAVPAMVGLGGAFFAGLAYNWVRKLRHTDDPLNVMLYFPAVSIVGSLPVAHTFILPQGNEWLLLLGVGVTAVAAQWLLTKALHHDEAGRVMNMAYIGVVFAAIWGVLFFNEVPDYRSVIGAGIVLVALINVARSRV
ncbi:MAG: DMT family transporter [Calditrichia bacterium]